MDAIGIMVMVGVFALLFLTMFLVIKYCNKTLKIGLSTIIVLIILYFAILSIDMSKVNSFHKPIFVWQKNNSNSTVVEASYQGIGYQVIVKYFENGKTESITMYMFDKVVASAVT